MNEVNDVVGVINNGGVAVIPTDTVYGLVGSAIDKEVVERIHRLKSRSDSKPFIVLISSLGDLEKIGVHLEDDYKSLLMKYWPGPFSFIVPSNDENFRYLHMGMDLAIRWPQDKQLETIIQQTGPLVAPSANPEGLKTAATIKEAIEYFGDEVDYYLDGGVLEGEPSTLISLKKGKIEILRQGRGKIQI